MALHKFLCPQCREEVSVPREAIGQRGKCCMCGEMVLVPSPEKDKAFRQRLVDEQHAKLEEKRRQDEAKRMREDEEQRMAAERVCIRLEEEHKREEERVREERKREDERHAENRRLYEARQAEIKRTEQEKKRTEQEKFDSPGIIEPGDSAAFVHVMGVILIVAGIVAGGWGVVEASNKQSALPFIIGAIVLLQCFLVAAFFFLACGVTHNIFYICKNLEHYSLRWQDGNERK